MSAAASTSASATITSAFAITTTFIAPTQCAQSIGGLTMLENDDFRIWLNALIPVPGTTIFSCYPDQFISSFLLQSAGVSQGPFNPLVCPDGYTTQGLFTSNYIACCPSGWDGFVPASNAPSDRPAFGGTCFTNIFNVPIQITSYDDSAIKASSIFTATNSNDQAFAYPYEGFALGVAVLASTTTSSQSTATRLPLDDTGTGSGGMKSGAVAGLVIGSITAVFLLVAVVVFALNYRHKRLTDRKSQLQFYNSHILLGESSTQMIYMDGSGKGVDVGAVTRRPDDQKIYQELEGSRRKTVYEMEAAPISATKAKELPDLPPPAESA